MAFSATPDQLLNWISDAEDRRDQKLRSLGPLVRRFVGTAYDARSVDPTEDDPEAHTYAYISYMLPQLVYANPQVRVNTRGVAGNEYVQAAMKEAINAWCEQNDITSTLELIAMDMMFCWGVGMVRLEQNQRWAGGVVNPVLERISPLDFFFDPVCSTRRESKFWGHRSWIDYEDLMADAEKNPDLYNAETISWLRVYQSSPARDGVVGADPRDDSTRAFKKKDPLQYEHRQLRVYNLWFAETNTIQVWVATDNSLKPLRDEFVWFGPREGPYVIFGSHEVPDEPYPLGPLTAVDSQVKTLNEQARALLESAKSYKRFAMVSSTKPEQQEAVSISAPGEVWSVPMFDPGQMAQVEIGGAMPMQYEGLSLFRDQVERASGLNEVARGNVGVAETATEINQANTALDQRRGHMRRRMQMAVESVLYKVGWMMFHSKNFVIGVRVEQANGQYIDAIFLGGQHEHDDGAKWEDYVPVIQPMTMQQPTEEQQKINAMEVVGLVERVSMLMQQMPFINGEALLDWVLDSMGQRDFAARFINSEMLGRFQRQVMGVQGTSSQGSPVDLGVAGLGAAGRNPGISGGPPGGGKRGVRHFNGQQAAPRSGRLPRPQDASMTPRSTAGRTPKGPAPIRGT